ncbi:hypothetical protein [Candidatus Parabeggiatoa sp. HSG14]|uniref:hypothetical protein n=1 Tax=Candidatus Parabeggiatoa sp. HSG14 TaxID=3055593 RepID=UPI0025A6B14E|nr:hypothetical protein [Thiotrichales bacterium HSG14]
MNRLQLVAETPRAGLWNHRFVITPHVSLSEREIVKVITRARHNPYGDNYLAVSSKTAQMRAGRIGREILVLVGLGELSSEQHEQAVQLLKKKSFELARLVTQTIDWEIEGKQLFVVRSELAKWEKDFRHFPTFKPKKQISLMRWWLDKLITNSSNNPILSR